MYVVYTLDIYQGKSVRGRRTGIGSATPTKIVPPPEFEMAITPLASEALTSPRTLQAFFVEAGRPAALDLDDLANTSPRARCGTRT